MPPSEDSYGPDQHAAEANREPDRHRCARCDSVEELLCYRDDRPEENVCPECCDAEGGHEWEYDRWERGDVCARCGIQKRNTRYAHEPRD